MAKSKPETSIVNPSEMPMTDYEKLILATIQGWEKDDTSFSPYLKIEGVGSCFFGRVCSIDARDPDFIRYIIQAKVAPVKCQKGPVNDADEVIVPVDGFFTVAAYAGLPIERYFDMEIFAKVVSEEDLKPTAEAKVRTFYKWDVLLSPENRRKVELRKREEMEALIARRTLGEGEVIPKAPQLASAQA